MSFVINSLNNNLIKELKKLKKKKYRNEMGLYIIESKKMIDEAIKSKIIIRDIFVREGEELIYPNVNIISPKIFNDISSLVTPDGYLAVVEKRERNKLSTKILVLDKLQDPGNMGTLIRSAEAFGFNTIISIDSCDYYNEKVLRSSMGSIFRLNLINANYSELENIFVEYKLLVADMNGKDYRELEFNEKIALVIGNEGNGISKEILNYNHELIKITMQGEIESLNAGVSGSILMSNFC